MVETPGTEEIEKSILGMIYVCVMYGRGRNARPQISFQSLSVPCRDVERKNVVDDTTFLTSFLPFSARFSSSSAAFRIKSGLTSLFSSTLLSLFLCTARASRSTFCAASSLLSTASSTAARESSVDGGSGMLISIGFSAFVVGMRRSGEFWR